VSGVQSPVEQAVARIWCDVLDVPSAHPDDNFMASGGDSVHVIQLLSRLYDELDVEVPLLDFLGAPTIATILGVIAANQ
jgi:acyl carrier protein